MGNEQGHENSSNSLKALVGQHLTLFPAANKGKTADRYQFDTHQTRIGFSKLGQ